MSLGFLAMTRPKGEAIHSRTLKKPRKHGCLRGFYLSFTWFSESKESLLMALFKFIHYVVHR